MSPQTPFDITGTEACLWPMAKDILWANDAQVESCAMAD